MSLGLWHLYLIANFIFPIYFTIVFFAIHFSFPYVNTDFHLLDPFITTYYFPVGLTANQFLFVSFFHCLPSPFTTNACRKHRLAVRPILLRLTDWPRWGERPGCTDSPKSLSPTAGVNGRHAIR